MARQFSQDPGQLVLCLLFKLVINTVAVRINGHCCRAQVLNTQGREAELRDVLVPVRGYHPFYGL